MRFTLEISNEKLCRRRALRAKLSADLIPVSRPNLSRPFIVAAVTALLALHAWLAVSATIDLGITGDETVHLTGGYSYWTFNDYRLHPENGNLPQRWAALPLVFAHANLDPTAWPSDWKNSDPWMAGQHFFFESGNPIDFLLLCARSMMVVWSVASGLLVFLWARSLWGDTPALFSLVLFCLSPTMLAHGALVTSDMCATFWLLAATWAWTRLTARITVGRLAISLVATGLAMVSKFTCLVLIPVFLLIGVWRLRTCSRQPNHGDSANAASDILPKPIRLIAMAGLHFATAFLVIWAFFGFRYTAFAATLPPATDFFSSFTAMVPATGGWRWILLPLHQLRLLPEAFVQGLTYVVYAARERPAFLAGEYSNTGWWWFFPFAFLVKSSIAELLTATFLIVGATITWIRNRTRLELIIRPAIPLLIFATVYGFVSMTSHLNIGQRHILPLYPVLFILAGAILGPGAVGTDRRHTSVTTGFAIVVGGVALFACAFIRPDYLAFFNRLARGPDHGRRLLGDSSLDWGQNLPSLATWLQRNNRSGGTVYLSYFGADDPFYRGIKAIELAPYYSFGRRREWKDLKGGLYCVGASMLQDAASPYRGPWSRAFETRYQILSIKVSHALAASNRSRVISDQNTTDPELWNLDRLRFARLAQLLRVRPPNAVIGQNIFVYHLTDEDVRRATRGNVAELATVMEDAVEATPDSGMPSR